MRYFSKVKGNYNNIERDTRDMLEVDFSNINQHVNLKCILANGNSFH